MGTALARAGQTIRVPLANGFDLPVGKPDGEGFYVFRGYYPGGHLGEDWNGNGGGDSDLGDPVYATGGGVVVFSEDYLRGWGNVVIVRHAYIDETGRVTLADSLYGHLDRRMVRKYQLVQRGQQLAVWIRAVLLHHTAYLMAAPGVQPVLTSLYQVGGPWQKQA